MIKIFLTTIYLTLSTVLFLSIPGKQENKTIEYERNENPDGPNELFYLQRSYPDVNFSWQAYQNSQKNIQDAVNDRMYVRISTSIGFNATWNLEGPGNIGGRINVVAVNPVDSNIIYAGNSTGGIFKTTDGGNTWFPVFDTHSYLSIGAIVFEPGNPNTIYAGTGDPNISGFAFTGDGIYKSIDAGATWTHLGLSAESIISKIIINPQDTNIIYVATMGIPFQHDTNRGLYKTTDGGLSWNNVLFVSDSAGIIDLIMDHSNPNILYAASWNRIRNNHQSILHGNDAKIFKTTNGGTNWTSLSGGLPIGDYSRISITMSGLNSNVLYASYSDTSAELYGIFKTVDGGSNWNQVPANGLSAPFNKQGWYSGGIKVNPTNDDELFLCGVDLYKSTDGGFSWNFGAPEWWQYIVHGDMHDVEYTSANTIYLTTDGGMYKTTDGGINWSDIENIPNNQFYHVTYDPINIGIYAGGVQDNGTTAGNNMMLNNWSRIYGGDGFTIIYHPTDQNIIYAETQNGNIAFTSDGGMSFNDGNFGIDTNDARNWDMPYIMSSANSDVLYTGTTKIYKNMGGIGVFWSAISPNLIDSSFTNESRFHTITCITESNVNTNDLYAGTSDGNVWRSLDAGMSWTNVTGTLPDRYVTNVKASKVNSTVAYVTHSGYRDNDVIPHVHRTTDNGNTWTDISGDLPQIGVNCMMTISGTDSILLVGTDGGVYATLNGGINWQRVGSNMPVVPVYDLAFDPNANKILAGTHGRSMMSYPMDSILFTLIEKPNSNIAEINIYPNPSTDHLTIQMDYSGSVNAKISILSVDGALIRKSELRITKSTTIPVNDLTPGVYFIIAKGEGINVVKRFLKQ